MRQLIASVRVPLRRAAVLAFAGLLLGAGLALLPLALPVDAAPGLLRGLTWLPGLSEGVTITEGGSRGTVDVGFDAPVEGASWPLPDVPGPTGIGVRLPLVGALALWGLLLGALAGLLWQSNAARRSVGGGFAAGAAAGLAVALLLPVVPGPPAAALFGRLALLPGLARSVEQNTFAGRVFEQHVELRSGRTTLAAVALGEEGRPGGQPPEVPARGQAALALLGGLFGVAVGLLVAGARRRARAVALLPLGLGGGLLAWLALPFLPAAVHRAALAALEVLPGVARSGEAIGLGPVVLARLAAAGDPPAPALAGITLALLALATVVAGLLAAPLVAAFAGLAALGRRREIRARQARLAERMAPTEPLPFEPDGAGPAEPPDSIPFEPAPPSDPS